MAEAFRSAAWSARPSRCSPGCPGEASWRTLRRTPRQLAVPAASVAVVAALGLAPLIAGGGHDRPSPLPAVRVPLTETASTAGAPDTAGAGAKAATAPEQAPSASGSDGPAQRSPLPVHLRDVRACTATSNADVGVNCLPRQPQPRLYVGPALPDNPLGIQRVAIEHRTLDCSPVPTTMLTDCRADGGPASTSPLPDLPLIRAAGTSGARS